MPPRLRKKDGCCIVNLTELLPALLAPEGELPHSAHVGLQAFLDAIPIALMEFRLHGERLLLQSANAVARRTPGLGAVREEGADAAVVFDELADSDLIDQLRSVVRLGMPLDKREVLREGQRIKLAWDLSARHITQNCLLVWVRDASEAENLRLTLDTTQAQLNEVKRELHEQTEVFGTMEALAHAGHWRRIEDSGEKMLLWSPGLCRIAGFERQEWMNTEYATSGIVPEDRALYEQAHRSQKESQIEYRWRRPDGEVRWMRSRVQSMRTRDDISVQMGVVQDVTEEHRAAEQLRGQLMFIRRIASRVPGFIYQYRFDPQEENPTASVQYISDAVRELLGVEPADVMKNYDVLLQRVLPEDELRLRRSMLASVRRMVTWQCEYRVRMPDGNVRWHMTSAVPHRESDGSVVSHGFTMDITERKRAEQQIERLAFYDALTGLPNRRLLLDRLRRALAQCQRTHQQGALLFIDLDNFKVLNDTLGHDMGDQLLIEVARRLSACVRESDTVARFGGDEFVIMLENLAPDIDQAILGAQAVAHKLLTHVNQPIELLGKPHYSSPSIGIALFGDKRVEVDELLKRADLAMYEAKSAGRNTLRFFDPSMQAAINARLHLEADMRQGLGRGEFSVHYQPIVDEQARLVGAEALLRWQHPRRGMVSPAEFIPLAEHNGVILELGRFVLHHACAQLAQWATNPATAHLSLSVNVSARQFHRVDFVAEVLDAVHTHHIAPQRLMLELTESMLLGEFSGAVQRMEELRKIGIRFALDDFGTGYSSLSYLKRLPLNQIKIDRSFVHEVLSDPNDAAIVRTILALAQSLDLHVVAEGVETAGQLGFLRLHGCHGFQGYLFGRPAPLQSWNTLLFLAAGGNDGKDR